MIFVDIALPYMRNKSLPDSGGAARLKLMTFVIPSVEGAGYRNPFRIGRPYSEIDALNAVDVSQMRPKAFVQLQVAAFIEQVQIVIGQQRHQGVPWRFRTFFGFGRGAVSCGGANWAALSWLLGHSEEASPPTDPRDSQARYRPHFRTEIAKLHNMCPSWTPRPVRSVEPGPRAHVSF